MPRPVEAVPRLVLLDEVAAEVDLRSVLESLVRLLLVLRLEEELLADVLELLRLEELLVEVLALLVLLRLLEEVAAVELLRLGVVAVELWLRDGVVPVLVPRSLLVEVRLPLCAGAEVVRLGVDGAALWLLRLPAGAEVRVPVTELLAGAVRVEETLVFPRYSWPLSLR